MPRDARRTSASGVYHVMQRGINRQDLFNDHEDMMKMLNVLAECVQIGKFRLHAYCLMTNHIHLLAQLGIEPDADGLAQVMKRIGVRYAIHYNRKYERIGPLFQDRFKSETVETETYFLSLLRYIHRNPVKAGMVQSPSQYSWSSYGAYRQSSTASFVHCELGKKLLGDQFTAYMEVDDGVVYVDDKETPRHMGDSELSVMIEDLIKIKPSAIITMERRSRSEALRNIAAIPGISCRQLSRVTGLSKSEISRGINEEKAPSLL